MPTYRLDWIVVGYSGVATGAFWDTLLVVASGAPLIQPPVVSHSRHSIVELAIGTLRHHADG